MEILFSTTEIKWTNSLEDPQDEIDNLNSPISVKEIWFLANKHWLYSGPDDFMDKFCQIRKKEIIPILHKLFQNI